MADHTAVEPSQFELVDAPSGASQYMPGGERSSWVLVDDPNILPESERRRREAIQHAQDEAITRQVLHRQRIASGADDDDPVMDTKERLELAEVAKAAAMAERQSCIRLEAQRTRDEQASNALIEQLRRSSPPPVVQSRGGHQCDCLGASGGHHRKDCPMRTA